jgi:hypothetical protein
MTLRDLVALFQRDVERPREVFVWVFDTKKVVSADDSTIVS